MKKVLIPIGVLWVIMWMGCFGHATNNPACFEDFWNTGHQRMKMECGVTIFPIAWPFYLSWMLQGSSQSIQDAALAVGASK